MRAMETPHITRHVLYRNNLRKKELFTQSLKRETLAMTQRQSVLSPTLAPAPSSDVHL